MFFANSLGPTPEQPTVEGLYHHVAAKFPGRQGVPSHDLYRAMEAVIAEHKLFINAAAGLDKLAQAGLLRFDAETNTAYFTG